MKNNHFFCSRNCLNRDCFTISFTALPTILGDIAQGLGVEVSSLGILTSLPLLMFALFSAFCKPLGTKKSGWKHLFTYCLLLLTVGSVIRIFNLPFSI